MLELILGMSLLEKVFLTFALSGTVVFAIRMLLMFSGIVGGAHGDFDSGGHDAPEIGHDAHIELAHDVHDDIAHDMAGDHDGDTSGEHGHDNSDVSFHFISIQGLTAFFMMFGWVGLAIMRDSGLSAWLAVGGGAVAGCVTVWILAMMFRCVGSMQCDGTMRVKSALGAGGTVYVRVPAAGSGQVQVEVDGRLTVFDAISSNKEEIKSGEQITVVWVQDNGVLIVEKDKREAGGKLCGQ